MDYDEIVKKSGAEWTVEEINFVFEQLMRDVDRFVKFAYRKLLSSETTDKLERAKDLVQDKIVALYRNLNNYDPGKYTGKKDPLQNYLFTIVANEAKEINKKIIRQQALQLREFEQPKEPKRLSREEVSEEIATYLDKLPETYRLALKLFYLEGMTCEEASLICGCSVAAFKVRLHRARKQCQKWRKEKLR
jgi:RNA polymerase sigma factor (sigma-70 family)